MKAFGKYLFILAGGLTTLSSCNDFLDMEPLDAVTPETFFYSVSDYAAYAVAHYNFTTPSGWGADFLRADNGTDNQISTSYSNQWLPGEWRTTESYSSGDPWDFEQIRDLNYFFEVALPHVENGDVQDETVYHYIGEVYFLRAKAYFDKLRTLGDFPIVTETLPDEMEPLVAASKRQPRHKVARFILEDLDRAIELLTNNPDGGKNRITQNAAYLLKSRVALYEASWLTYHKGTALVPGGPGWPGDAADVADFNIDSEISFFLQQCKEASLALVNAVEFTTNTAAVCEDELVPTDDDQYKMSNPYFAQFSDNSLEAYPEILLWRDYDQDQFQISHSNVFYTRRGGNTGYTRQFVETFLCRDGLPIYASPLYQGDATLLDVRKNRDVRLQMFMMTPDEVLTPTMLVDGDGVEWPDTLAEAPNIVNTPAETRCVTGYQVRKGLSDNWYRDGNTGDEGIPVYRATEAYLNYIEASCIESGGNSIDGTAERLWGDLRERAGLPRDYRVTVNATDLSRESDFAVYSAGRQVSPLLYNIRRERRCELAVEGFRMDDLRRWRALDQLEGGSQKFWPEGINLWESDILEKCLSDGTVLGTLVVGDESSSANVSSYENTGKYLSPYRIIRDNNLMYERGYEWCEAHYLTPIAIRHFRITSSTTTDLGTSTIYQNPGWPTEASMPPVGY